MNHKIIWWCIMLALMSKTRRASIPWNGGPKIVQIWPNKRNMVPLRIHIIIIYILWNRHYMKMSCPLIFFKKRLALAIYTLEALLLIVLNQYANHGTMFDFYFELSIDFFFFFWLNHWTFQFSLLKNQSWTQKKEEKFLHSS